MYINCGPVVDFFITKQTSLHPFDFVRNLFHLLVCILFHDKFTVFCTLNSTSPPTHFTRAPPSHAKNRYLNSRLMILHASELATELFDEVQSQYVAVSLRYRSRLQSYQRGLRHVHGITQYKMASNIQLTTSRDREIAGLILLFR